MQHFGCVLLHLRVFGSKTQVRGSGVRRLFRGRPPRVGGGEELGAGGEERGTRAADWGEGLVAFPAAAEGFVDGDEIAGGGLLAYRVVVLQSIELALGVEQIEQLGEAAFVPLGRQLDGALAGGEGVVETVEAVPL